MYDIVQEPGEYSIYFWGSIAYNEEWDVRPCISLPPTPRQSMHTIQGLHGARLQYATALYHRRPALTLLARAVEGGTDEKVSVDDIMKVRGFF